MVPNHSETQPAWILHAQAYRETSLLLEVLTPASGRVGVIARGVRGGKKSQPLRAALQPFQPLQLSLKGRGDLAMLVSADVHDGPLRLAGRPLLSAFYVNELVMRLVPRHIAQPELFWRYGLCLNALNDESTLAWTLRRFERDLLTALGYGVDLATDSRTGQAIEAEGHYRVEPEVGLVGVRAGSPESVSGEALLALATDQAPSARAQSELRVLMRRLIGFQLGGRELRSWRILAELGPSGGAVRSAGADGD